MELKKIIKLRSDGVISNYSKIKDIKTYIIDTKSDYRYSSITTFRYCGNMYVQTYIYFTENAGIASSKTFKI